MIGTWTTGTARAGQAVGATPRAYTGRSSWASVRLSRHSPSITIPATPAPQRLGGEQLTGHRVLVDRPTTTRTSPGRPSRSPASTGIRSSCASTVTARPTIRRPEPMGRMATGSTRRLLSASENVLVARRLSRVSSSGGSVIWGSLMGTSLVPGRGRSGRGLAESPTMTRRVLEIETLAAFDAHVAEPAT